MKKILIVDDEPDALKMVTLTLQAEGYQVVTGSDGEEALRLAQAEHPDLIMLDVMMPKLNGYEVARRLRRLPEFSQVPILFLSARGQVEDKVEGLRVGGNDYVTKPAAPQELAARVGVLLGTFSQSAGYVVALFGGKGGVGTTTLSVNLALALQEQTHETVILVDGHDEGGDVGIFLNIPTSHHVGELMVLIDQLDKEIFHSVLAQHSSGLKILLAPPDTSTTPAILPSHWEKILDELRRLANYVVFDGPLLHSVSWAPVLGVADDVFLITTPEIPAMRRMATAYNLARARSKNASNVYALLNRYTEQSGFSTSAIGRALEFPISTRIDDVGPLSTYAINHGEPVLLTDRRCSIARATTSLAREIVQRNKDSKRGG